MKKNRNTKSLDKIVSESLRRTLTELDWKTTDNATDNANYKYQYDMAMYKFDDFKEASEALIQLISNSPQGKQIADRLKMVMADAEKFCMRKEKQAGTLDKYAADNFQNKFGMSRKDMEQRIYDLYDEHGWENVEDDEWRQQNLSPEEIDCFENQ
jgi:hypothetical protein